MQKRQRNFQLYEQIKDLLDQEKPWSREYIRLINELDPEPDYPMDDPMLVDLIKFALDEAEKIDPLIARKANPIKHALEVNFDTFDIFHYDLLSTYLYDLANHMYGLNEPHLSADEIKSLKVKSLAKLIESLAAICANNAFLLGEE